MSRKVGTEQYKGAQGDYLSNCTHGSIIQLSNCYQNVQYVVYQLYLNKVRQRCREMCTDMSMI